MPTTVADLIATLRMDASQFNRSASQVTQQVEKMGKGFGLLKTQAGIQVAQQIAQWSNALVGFGKELMAQGVQSEAFGRKFRAVFGENTEALDKWVTEHHSSFGVAEDEVQGYLAQIGNLLVGMGNTADEAGRQATEILDLAGAWSAWSGGQISVQDASDKLVKGMMGQTRGLIELGLKVTEEEVAARMAAEGLNNLTGAEAARAKQQVMFTLIQEKSTTVVEAYGDALDGAYGAQMKLRTALDEAKDAMGQVVVQASPLLSAFADLGGVPVIGTSVMGMLVGGALKGGVGALAGAVLGLTAGLVQVFDNPAFDQFVELLDKLPQAAADGAEAVDTLRISMEKLDQLTGDELRGFLADAQGFYEQAGDTLDAALLAQQYGLGLAHVAALERGRDAYRELTGAAATAEQVVAGVTARLRTILGRGWMIATPAVGGLPSGGDILDWMIPNRGDLSYRVQTAVADIWQGLQFPAVSLNRLFGTDFFTQFTKGGRAAAQKEAIEMRKAFLAALAPRPAEIANAFSAVPAAIEGLNFEIMLQNLIDRQTFEQDWATLMATAGEYGLDALIAQFDELSPEMRATILEYADDISKLLQLNATLNLPVVQGVYSHYGSYMGYIPISAQPREDGERAAGGPVWPGGRFIVGEKGPELFMPRTAGTIIPNSQTGSAGSTTVHVHVAGSLIAEAELARIVEDQMIRASRRGASSEVF